MSAPVIASIVGGVCTILASVLTVYVKRYIDERDTHQLSNARQRQVEGRWSGAFLQRPADEEPAASNAASDPASETRTERLGEHDAEFDLQYENRTVRGTGWFVSSTGRKDFLVTGHFHDENHVQLSYSSRRDGVKQYGVALLRLSADCTTLTGQFIGYGVNTEEIISGRIQLENARRA